MDEQRLCKEYLNIQNLQNELQKQIHQQEIRQI